MKTKRLLVFLTIFIATIVLISFRQEKKSIEYCDTQPDTLTCREKNVISVLQKRGAKNAFLAMEKLKWHDPDFGPICHAFAHTIGVAAYPLILKGVDVFAKPISTCDLGYIHGLMMEVVMHKNDFVFANNFCQKLKPKLGEDHASYEQCYHGSGHGIPLFLFISKNAGRNTVNKQEILEIIKESLIICDKNFNSEPECKRGVFGGVTSFFTGDHGITLSNTDIKDLFGICKPQSDSLKKSCYEMIAPALMTLTENNLDKSIYFTLQYLVNTPDLFLMAQPLGSLIINSIQHPAPSQIVDICRKIGTNAESSVCVKGYVTSMANFVQIKDFKRDVLSFCDSNVFNTEERRYCRLGALSQARGLVSRAKFIDLCKNLNSEERGAFCN